MEVSSELYEEKERRQKWNVKEFWKLLIPSSQLSTSYDPISFLSYDINLSIDEPYKGKLNHGTS